MAEGNVVFRRIRGRIVPIKVNAGRAASKAGRVAKDALSAASLGLSGTIGAAGMYQFGRKVARKAVTSAAIATAVIPASAAFVGMQASKKLRNKFSSFGKSGMGIRKAGVSSIGAASLGAKRGASIARNTFSLKGTRGLKSTLVLGGASLGYLAYKKIRSKN